MNSHWKCTCCGESYRQGHEKITTPKGNFAGYQHVEAFLKGENAKRLFKLQAKKKKQKVKRTPEQKAFDKKVLENDVSYQFGLTIKRFNKLRKLQEFKWFADRGLAPSCISCGKENMDWCNGHLKTVGSQKGLSLDPMNSYLQCNRYCNCGLSGNINGNKTTRGYLQGLADRFGEERAREIIDYCSVDSKADWTGLELIAMRKQINIEIRELEANQ